MKYKQGNSFPYVIFISWCQMCQFFFHLLSTNIVKYNIILCQLFSQQTGAVKTLQPHNHISLILTFYISNSIFSYSLKFFFSVAIRNIQLTTFSLYSSISIRVLLLFNQLFLFKFCSSFFFQFPRINSNVELSPS